MFIKEAIILAGGKGTRLRSVIKNIPKPMATISGKPFLEILIELFENKGIEHFIISVGYLSDHIIDYFKQKKLNVKITFSVEKEPLGTGGAIRLAMNKIKGDYALILNGDSYFNVELNALNLMQDVKKPIIFCRYANDVSRYGKVIVNGNKIEKFAEKNSNGPGIINGGVYILPKKMFENYPLHTNFSIESELSKNLTKNNYARAIVSDGYFIDIGIPEDYKRAQTELRKIVKKKALFLDRDGVINVDKGYVHTPEQCVFINGIKNLLQNAKKLNYIIIIITNQSGIGRGYYNEEQFHLFMKWLNKSLGNLIDDYYFCPFHEDYGIGKYKIKSFDRKPNPGMINKAIKDHNIDPLNSIFIGDNISDMIAADRSNIECKLLLRNEENNKKAKFKSISNLEEVNSYLI